MSKVIVANHLTLDGVMQAPGRPDEDPREGFAHGGWAQPRSDATVGKALGQALANSGSFLFGRRTFESFAAHWPHQTDGNPFTQALDNTRKYVVSRTLRDPLTWQNSTLVADPAEAVARARREHPGKDTTVFGSGELARSLAREHLVDEYLLMIHPLVLATGRRLFGSGADAFANLQLVDCMSAPSGVVVATYRPAVRAGS